MSKPATHLIVQYKSKDTDLLYRAADGMALACRQGVTVISGEDPNPAKKEHRNFLDVTFAVMYLKRLAELDANHITPADYLRLIGPGEQLQYAATCEERDGESKILKPNGQLVNAAAN